MPKLKRTPTVDKSYSPEFKLSVVLEYVRSPKKKKRICQKNKVSEELLTQWHQEFVARAQLIFSDTPSPNPSTQTPTSKDNETVVAPKDEQVSQPLSAWGIRLNRSVAGSSQSISSVPELPKWFSFFAREAWKDNRGVVFWDRIAQKSEVLSAEHTLELLQKMRQSDEWRTEGIGIMHRVLRMNWSDAPKGNRARKKKMPDEPVTVEPEPSSKEVEEESMHLNAQAAMETLDFLQRHEENLKQMAEEEHKIRVQALARAYSLILSWEPKDD